MEERVVSSYSSFCDPCFLYGAGQAFEGFI